VSKTREKNAVVQLLLGDEFSDAASSSLGSASVGQKAGRHLNKLNRA